MKKLPTKKRSRLRISSKYLYNKIDELDRIGSYCSSDVEEVIDCLNLASRNEACIGLVIHWIRLADVSCPNEFDDRLALEELIDMVDDL